MSNPLRDARARLVIAHRGNRVAAPENTLVALAQAEQLGADALEFDVRATRDGVPVLMHDALVDRTTNGHGRLDAYSLAELRALDAARLHPQAEAGRVTIPTLEEVLDRFRRLPLVIEIKEVRALDAAILLIRKFGAEDRVVIGSAVAGVMHRLYASGLDACASMHDAVALIPHALSGSTPPARRYRVLSLTPTYLTIPIPIIRLADAARRLGVPTHVWTVNDPALAHTYWQAGVAGIITDAPAAMLRLRAHSFGDAA